MRDRFQTHCLYVACRQRRTPGGCAEQYKAPAVLSENRPVIRAFGVNPEFQHAARCVNRSRHPPLPLQFTNIANVDEHGLAGRLLAQRFHRFEGRDCGIGLFDQLGGACLHEIIWPACASPLGRTLAAGGRATQSGCLLRERRKDQSVVCETAASFASLLAPARTLPTKPTPNAATKAQAVTGQHDFSVVSFIQSPSVLTQRRQKCRPADAD